MWTESWPWAISDPLVPDAEKGAAAAVVDARKARLIRRGLDVFFVVYLLFSVGGVALMVMVSDKWWEPWPGVAFITPICITTLWMTPKMKGVYIQLYATKRSPGSDRNLSTKLLASKK
ncbi:unnamed protein product [Urochloa decumbens]|uniref:Uncharacterized protein n=1 Tax=Urochloa decumbens TaxID=240449 RepID=A0ABC9AP74_9POAL